MSESHTKISPWPFFLQQLFHEPFVAIFASIGVLLTRELHATPLHIAFLTMATPALSLLAFYCSFFLFQYHRYIKTFSIMALMASMVFFIFAPLANTVWFFIIATANYSFFFHLATPALLEMIKLHTSIYKRCKAVFSPIAHGIGFALALIWGGLLDSSPDVWKYLISTCAILGLVSPLALIWADTPTQPVEKQTHWLQPVRQSWNLLCRRRDFAHFHFSFFIVSFGLMMVLTTIPILVCTDTISYITVLCSMSTVKGLFLVLSSPLWAKALEKYPIQQISQWIFIGFACFMAILVFTIYQPICLPIAYAIYGIAQGGRHLVWPLSATIFSRHESSFHYSAINVCMVGIRGMLAPLISSAIAIWLGPYWIIGIGIICCGIGYAIIAQSMSNDCSKSASC